MPELRLGLALGMGKAEGQLFALAVVLICQLYGREQREVERLGVGVGGKCWGSSCLKWFIIGWRRDFLWRSV